MDDPNCGGAAVPAHAARASGAPGEDGRAHGGGGPVDDAMTAAGAVALVSHVKVAGCCRLAATAYEGPSKW